MKGFKKLLGIFLIGMLALNYSSCSHDDIEPPHEDPSKEPIVMSFDTFNNQDDVIITAADTTTISVSKKYLETMNYKFIIKDRDTIPVTIWRTIDTSPFVRNVIKSVEQGDRVILTTVSGDLGDVLSDNDLKLDTDIYVDFSKSRVVMRGGTAVDNYDRYVDNGGVIHPAVIIPDEDGIEGCSQITSGIGQSEKKYYTAEDIAMSNPDFRIIDVDMNLGNHSLTSPEKELKLYIKDTNLKAKAGVRINLKTRSCKLKEFECAVYGDFGLDYTFGIESKASIKNWEKEEDIAKFSGYTYVFWVGYIPVAITCNAGVLMKATAEVSASCQFETSMKLHADYDAGVYYSGQWYDRSSAHAGASAEFNIIKPLEVTAEASAGIELFTDLKLYDCAGPKLTFGPSVEASLSASFNALEKQLEFSTEGGVNVGGKYGVEMKILKWQLASWQQKYSLFKKDLWKYTGSKKI